MSDAFSQRLAAALSARGMAQGTLATACGVSAQAVSSWVRGQMPRPAKLVQIAQTLGVSVDYLATGTGGIPVDIDALRATYRESLSVFARPAPFDGGREYGNTAEHAFQLDLRILGREVGQNSGDEEVEGAGGVDMRFTVIELTDAVFDSFVGSGWWNRYRQHLEASALGGLKAARQIKQSIERLDRDRRLVLLRVDDYGANGLTGNEYESGRFTAVMRNQLDSQKSEAGGGSYGLGKNAMWGCSEFSLVFANSRLSVPENGHTEDRFFGRGQLPAHTLEGVDYAGPIWIGEPDPDRANPVPGMPPTVRSIFENPVLAKDFFLDRGDERSGSSFLIVGFFDPSGAANGLGEMAAQLANSMSENFWAAMTARPDRPAKLRVEIRVQQNQTVTSTVTVANDAAKAGFVKAYESYLAGETVDHPGQLVHVGDVVSIPIILTVPKRLSSPPHPEEQHIATLLIRVAESTEDHVNRIAWLRGSLMTIAEERLSGLPIGATPFHAVLLAGKAAGHDTSSAYAESFLRAGEPPQHDRWTGTSDLTTSYARGAKTKLADFQRTVLEAVREAVRRPSGGSSDGPADLKNLLRIGAPPPPVEKRPHVRTASGYPGPDGAWPIEAVISLPVPQHRRLNEWRLTPVIRFAAYSGSGADIQWRTLEAVSNCHVEDGQLVAAVGTRTLRFRGVTDPSTHPVKAEFAKAIVDIRIQKGRVQ